jgi:hypothetical protein
MSASTEPFEEMSEAELAGQAERPKPDDYPFQLGRTAAEQGKGLDVNPFTRGSHKAKLLKDGWNNFIVEQSNKRMIPPPQPQKQEEPKVARTHKVPPKPGVQEELIPDSRIVGKAGDESVELPEEIKAILQQTDDAIYNAALYKGQENEFKAQMVELMKEHHLNEVNLPRGGKLVYKPGKPSATYVAPKDAAKKVESGSDEGSQGDAE